MLLLLLLELKNLGLYFYALSLLCISISTVLGAFFIKVLAKSLSSRSSCFNSNPTIPFCASTVEISLNKSSKGFRLQKIFFSIESNFCLKLPLLSLSHVTYKLICSCIPFPKSLVARRYFYTSSVGIFVSVSIQL